MGFVMADDYFGGAVLADNTLGSASFTDASGMTISFSVSDDPEYRMSGLEDPCSSFEQW